jgi:hypothetical protein
MRVGTLWNCNSLPWLHTSPSTADDLFWSERKTGCFPLLLSNFRFPDSVIALFLSDFNDGESSR